MERELWTALCAFAARLDNQLTKARYTDHVVCAVYWWAVIHDRPVVWACDASNWPSSPRRLILPSQPTMSRRLRSSSVESLLLDVEQALATVCFAAGCILSVDGKPLPVSGASRDADARWGRGAGGIAKGYKLHAIWGEGPLPVAWALTSLNVSERRMAAKLAASLPGSGYLLGDKVYDVNYLYDAAAESNYQLLAPQQRPGQGLGHRRHSPYRLEGLRLLTTAAGKRIYRQRVRIEHRFAHLTTFVGGLGPLPFWVRRFHRVKLWVHSKLLIGAIHLNRVQQRKLVNE